MRGARDRRDEQPGFVLHSYPYRETSAIVEALTAAYGRVALVARGARRPRSELRGTLQAFQPLTLSWQGGGELKTLLKADWRGGLPRVGGLGAAVRLLPQRAAAQAAAARGSASAALRAPTRRRWRASPAAPSRRPLLRGFELTLLAELGYALPLTHEVDSGRPIDPGGRYYYAFDRGPRLTAAEPGRRYPQVRGATLLALAQQDFSAPEAMAEAKRLMREVLDHYLERRTIVSRRVVRDLQALEEAPEDAGEEPH